MLERIKPSDFESETQAKEFNEMSIRLALNFIETLDEIDGGMKLAWQLSEPAPAGCKTISQLRKGE